MRRKCTSGSQHHASTAPGCGWENEYWNKGSQHDTKLMPPQKFSNHEIVKFLEAIGAQFGACQVSRSSNELAREGG